jgi:hypothetical protein
MSLEFSCLIIVFERISFVTGLYCAMIEGKLPNWEIPSIWETLTGSPRNISHWEILPKQEILANWKVLPTWETRPYFITWKPSKEGTTSLHGNTSQLRNSSRLGKVSQSETYTIGKPFRAWEHLPAWNHFSAVKYFPTGNPLPASPLLAWQLLEINSIGSNYMTGSNFLAFFLRMAGP